MNLKQLAALGLRCCALYLGWKSLGFLIDYVQASMIYDSLRPGTTVDDPNNNLAYLQGKYGSGVSLQLCHTIFGYFALYLFAAVLLWCFSIGLARILTKDIETA